MRKFLLCLALMAIAFPVLAAKGDHIVQAFYLESSTQVIDSETFRYWAPTCHGHYRVATRTVETRSEGTGFGAGYQYGLRDNLVLDLKAWVPQGHVASDVLSVEAGVDYMVAGRFYLPLALGYENQLNSLRVSAGVGYAIPMADNITLGLEATAGYFEDADLEDRSDVRGLASVGWRY